MSPAQTQEVDLQTDDTPAGESPPLAQSVPVSRDAASVEDEKDYLISISKQPLRWGVTLMPDNISRDLAVDDEHVMHLSFGIEDHDVQEPQVGALYA